MSHAPYSTRPPPHSPSDPAGPHDTDSHAGSDSDPTTPRDPHTTNHPSSSSHSSTHTVPLPSSTNHDDTRNRTRTSRRRRPRRPKLSQAAKDGLAKKLQFLTHLSSRLDSLVFAELCVLYYMDCSFFRLFLRWVAQHLFISPRPDDSIIVVPNYHVPAIFMPNLICILLHLLYAPPFAGEATRGYLHGGVIVDFIGQTPPSSRFTLLLLDLLVFALQALMFSVNTEKERVRKIIKPPLSASAAAGFAAAGRATDATAPSQDNDGADDNDSENNDDEHETYNTGQDHDAEERGILRHAPTVDEDGAIELQPMLSSDGRNDRDRAGRASGELERLVDVLRSGNAVLSTFHVRRTLRTAWRDQGTGMGPNAGASASGRAGGIPDGAAARAIQSVGYNATLAALAAHRRARLAASRGGETVAGARNSGN